MGAQGTTTVNFGAFPGNTEASVTVTGQASIVGGSLVEAWLFPSTTADHSADEHYMASPLLAVIAGEVSAGVGFTIKAFVRDIVLEPLRPPGEGRGLYANATAGLNTSVFPTVLSSASVGGRAKRLHGEFTVAWVWN